VTGTVFRSLGHKSWLVVSNSQEQIPDIHLLVLLLVCLDLLMTIVPQENSDVTADDELSDEVLGGVSGGAVIGTPIAD
jgi:hypothetical protein